MRGLQNKRVIVTGGAHGIGRATVEAFLGYGCSVVISDIEEKAGRAAEETLRERGAVHFIHGDLAEADFCQRQVDFALERLGGVDFLINNAFSFVAAGLEAEREQWLRSMTVGPMGFAAMTQAVAEPMAEGGGGGAIVNLSSISAHIAQPGRWTYNAAKGAVTQLTRCSALDLAPLGIRVNAVSPGWIWTREVDKAAGYDREKYDVVWGRYHMLRRCGLAEEVASAILFLCSDEASMITGVCMEVDGGRCI